MDLRDAAICREVWRGWADYRPLRYSEIAERTGISTGSLVYRIRGHDGLNWRQPDGGLIQQGWLAAAPEGSGPARTIRPGERFVGLDSNGWPLEVLE